MPPSRTLSTSAAPINRLLSLQAFESNKPILSKLSWIPDIIRIRGSIIPSIWGPVLTVTLWSVGVAVGSELYGKHLGLTNSVVPLLSVVVGLLLVFRNSSAYERYSEGRKDFTTLISNARTLTRNIWVYTTLPVAKEGQHQMTRKELKDAKKALIKLVVGFVVATKHHLRAEGGMHHHDLKGLLPPSLTKFEFTSVTTDSPASSRSSSPSPNETSIPVPPKPKKSFFGRPIQALLEPGDQERLVGLPPSPRHKNFPPPASPRASPSQPGTPRGARQGVSFSHDDAEAEAGGRTQMAGEMVIGERGRTPRSPRHFVFGPKKDIRKRPTAVRIHSAPAASAAVVSDSPGSQDAGTPRAPAASVGRASGEEDERRPLLVKGIKAGIVPEERRVGSQTRTDEGSEELVRVVELGLPLIIAHEISRTIFRFRKTGCLETVGPAGFNTMQASVQSMTDQLGAMERVVQTPLPYIFAVHLKQCVSVYLFALPFTLVDVMGWRMVPLVTVVAFTLMGVEGIAEEVEQPFGTDPGDLNLDLYCAELRCEIEYIVDRLPEGEDDEYDELVRVADTKVDIKLDDGAAGDEADAGDAGDDFH